MCKYLGYAPFSKQQTVIAFINENLLIQLQLWCAECLECLEVCCVRVAVVPVFVQTLLAFSTPQLQPDKYIFMHQHLKRGFSALKKGLTLKICAPFVLSY